MNSNSEHKISRFRKKFHIYWLGRKIKPRFKWKDIKLNMVEIKTIYVNCDPVKVGYIKDSRIKEFFKNSDKITDEELSEFLCELYVESNENLSDFYRQYRNYKFLYEFHNEDLFKRFDKIISKSTELFKSL